MVFPVVMYGCESWTIKKAQHWRIDAFELWCWRRLLRVPWTARRSNQSILKEINPEYSLVGLMPKLKLQYFGHLMWKSRIIGKDPDAGKDWRQDKKGTTEDEMVGWHHQFNGHEFEQTLGDSKGQGSLACCSPWGRKAIMLQLKEKDISMFSQTLLFIFLYSELLELDNLQACCKHPCHTGPRLFCAFPNLFPGQQVPSEWQEQGNATQVTFLRVWKWIHQASPEQASDHIT